MSLKIRKTSRRGRQYWELDLRSIGQGRLFFSTKVRAESEKALRQAELDRHGQVLTDLSPADRLELVQCRERLAGVGASLSDAVDYFLTNHRSMTKKDLRQAIEEFLLAKERSGKRPRYCNQLRYNLLQFRQGLRRTECHQVQRSDVEKYIHSGEWEIRTRKGKAIDLGTFWGWAKNMGYCTVDPTEHLEKFTPEHKTPEILTIDQARKLMDTAMERVPKILPYLTLCLFAGIRPAEVFALAWKDVDLKAGIVRVESHQSKTRKRRVVELSENAIAWLSLKGPLPPANFHRCFERVRDLAGIVDWPQDVLRHTYCSYSLPIHGPMKTALNAGHSEQELFRSYRELVTPEAAREFWGIRP